MLFTYSVSTSIIAAGPAGFLSYAITGSLILLIMRMLGEMATALPHVRSFTEFIRAGLGDGAGFVSGWLYWYFWVLTVPVEAIAGAKILKLWLPGFTSLQIGVGLMSIMTAVNLMSARSYAEFEFWFASIKVAAILVFAHTVGEFGVVLMIGGNIPGRTKTLSIAIFDYVETLQYHVAHILAAGMLVFSFAVILVTMIIERRTGGRAP